MILRLPAHVALTECRQSLIGDQLDAWTLRMADETSEAAVSCLAGLLLLLHLCDPAQYTVAIAAAACAALVTLLAGGHSPHPHLRTAEVHRLAADATGGHSNVLVAAMQHDGVAAQAAQLRPDAIAVLAAGAFHACHSPGAAPQRVVQDNMELFESLQVSAVQVSLGP